jgi:hypothetical protein
MKMVGEDGDDDSCGIPRNDLRHYRLPLVEVAVVQVAVVAVAFLSDVGR